ncbi:Type I restriction modification DNA specificity domain protein [compost metagenome]
MRKGKLERDDIVLTTRGTVGNITHYNSFVPFDVIRINSGMVLLRSIDTAVISPKFFCELFKNDEMTREVKSFLSGSAQPQLPITNLKKIKFILPPIDLQSHFANIVTKIEEQKAFVKKAIDETQYLFDSLMSEYFE